MATQPIQVRQGNGGDFAGVRRDLLEARHLPGYVYTSPEIYELEIEKIFMKDWLCMGRVEEYAKPGDYQTFRIASEPVLIRLGRGRLPTAGRSTFTKKSPSPSMNCRKSRR